MSNAPAAVVLITGATGFVGRALCARLAKDGLPVIAGLRVPGAPPHGTAGSCLLGDLSLGEPLAARLAGVDAIVHLAGRAHVMRDAATDPEQAFFAANARASAHLAAEAARAGVRRLIFISNIKVNGESSDGRAPFCATDTPAPEDAYGRSKLAAEQALWRVAEARGLEVVVIRAPLLHGPGVKGNLAQLLRLIDLGLPLPLAGINNRRSLLALANLCDLIACCLQHPAAAGATLLPADPEPVSTPAIIAALAAGLGKSARLFPLPLLAALASVSGRHAALRRLTGSLVINGQEVQDLLGWHPGVDSETGLAQMAAAYRARTVLALASGVQIT